MSNFEYLDFDLRVEQASSYQLNTYHAYASSPSGEAKTEFKLPFSDQELENFIQILTPSHQIDRGLGKFIQIFTRSRQADRVSGSPGVDKARWWGGALFDAVFSNDIHLIYRRSLSEAKSKRAGLRVRLSMNSPELIRLPWEFLYDTREERFLSLSIDTPIVRYIDSPFKRRLLPIAPPLRILAVISNPTDSIAFDTGQQWKLLEEPTSQLVSRKQVEICTLTSATLSELQQQLRMSDFHVLHFIGQGFYDLEQEVGYLTFEDTARRPVKIDCKRLAALLGDSPARLVVLNLCESERGEKEYPYFAIAKSLVEMGLPAAIGMHGEMNDQLIPAFNREFYSALLDGYPIDNALAEARKAIFSSGDELGWGAPVLYSRESSNQVLTIQTDETRIMTTFRQNQAQRELELLIDKANLEMDHIIARWANYRLIEEITNAQKELDWFPISQINNLEPDIVELYPRLLAISQDISATNQSDLYARRLGLHTALNNLEQLRKRTSILGSKAKRWNPVYARWQDVFLAELEKTEFEIQPVQIPNLYQPGNPLQLSKKALFKGRQELRDAVVNALLEKTRPTLVLQGPRRMGKTSFLQQLPALLPGRTIPVFVDMQKPSLRANDGAFLYGVARAIRESIEPYHASLTLPDRDQFTSLTFQVFDDWLDDHVLPAMQDFNFLITFDEFEKLGQAIFEQKLSLQVLDELRYTIQHRTQIALLFAGVQTLDEMGPNWSSYFINVRSLTIGYLFPSEAEELIRNPEPGVEFGLSYTDESVRKILDDTLGHPYLIQLVCSSIVEQANNLKTQTADIALVEAGETLALERGEPYFRNIWDEMIAEDGRPMIRKLMDGHLLFSEHELDQNSTLALKRLVKLKVVKKINDSYAIEVPLVRQWIKERAPD